MNTGKYYQAKNLYPNLKNPQKYIAENKVITARSGWEISYIMQFLDHHTSVLSWSSEDLIIPYVKPTDGRIHRYFPDFRMELLESNGKKKEYIVEIKPHQQFLSVVNPKPPKRMTKSVILSIQDAAINTAKWDAARSFCKQQRLLGKTTEFVIITEQGIQFEDGRFEKIKLFGV